PRRFATQFGRRVDQSLTAFVVAPVHAEGLAPSPDHGDGNTPPVPDRRCGFAADSTGQFLIDQQPRATAAGAEGAAAWPGNARSRPARDDDVTVTSQARRPVPLSRCRPVSNFRVAARVNN